MEYLFVLAAVCATAAGQVLYKMYFDLQRTILLPAAMATFAIAPVCNFLALRTLEVGFVYMCTAFTHVLVLLLSAAILREPIATTQLGAGALIVSGIAVYGL